MPIPKAAPGDEYAYYFQFAVFCKEERNTAVFLDRYRYELCFEPVYTSLDVYVSTVDLERIYAPYLRFTEENGEVTACYAPTGKPAQTVRFSESVGIRRNGALLLPAIGVMGNGFGKKSLNNARFAVLAVDSPELPEKVYQSFPDFLPFVHFLHDKVYGEMNYAVWLEEARRLIPYRMYIPSRCREGGPYKTLVCFHGGDANAEYMFKHTDNEIELWAERENIILLALTSYRKFTFFGGNVLPAGDPGPHADPDNLAGLTPEEQEWSAIAAKSVRFQIEDAAGRWPIDMKDLYALGNSGGCIGIFYQTMTQPRGTFRAAVCSGGCPWPGGMDVKTLAESGTRFLLLQGSEDAYAGQTPFTEYWPALQKAGVDISFEAVGGGVHLVGWTRALDSVFRFISKE